MKRIVSRDVASKQQLSGALQFCCAHSDPVNSLNAKCPRAAPQSAGAVTLLHYKGKKRIEFLQQREE